jgi:hypothetical protein
VIALVAAVALVPQLLLAFTVIFPLAAFDVKYTTILGLVVVSVVALSPAGSVHVYDVAEATALIV